MTEPAGCIFLTNIHCTCKNNILLRDIYKLDYVKIKVYSPILYFSHTISLWSSEASLKVNG